MGGGHRLSAGFNVEAGSTGSWHGMKVVNDNDDTCEVNFTVTNNIDIS